MTEQGPAANAEFIDVCVCATANPLELAGIVWSSVKLMLSDLSSSGLNSWGVYIAALLAALWILSRIRVPSTRRHRSSSRSRY